MERVDALTAGLLFMACWADVVGSTDSDGMLVTVRRSKTNPEGEVNDVRFVKDGVSRVESGRYAPPRVRSRTTAWYRFRRR